MVENSEKTRAWPQANNKMSKDIIGLLNQSTQYKIVR